MQNRLSHMYIMKKYTHFTLNFKYERYLYASICIIILYYIDTNTYSQT